jgi:putative endonuclease
LGQRGEALAWQYLVDQGYEVLAANVRVGNHEADLIALDRQLSELIFCEVKTRQTDQFGEPSNAVDRQKIKSMQIVAKNYCRIHHLTFDYRFDIITVISGKIEHYVNITW